MAIFNDDEPQQIKGHAASGGKVKGIVKVVLNLEDIKKVEDGDILVAATINMNYMPALKKAAAVVTDHGEVTSHATIVSKEFGIPAVIATQFATRILSDGDVAEVDGDNGIVTKL